MKLRHFPLAALLLAAAPRALPAQTLPSARQVIDRYVQAIGGRAAIDGHTQRRMVADVTMPLIGRVQMELLNERPNRVVTRTEYPGLGSLLSGYDGRVAWEMDDLEGPRILTGDEAAMVVKQSSFDADMEFLKGDPATMRTVERAEMGGRPCWKVQTRSNAQEDVFHCFDVETGLLDGSLVVFKEDGAELETTITYADYREFDGVKMPTRTVTRVMGMEMVLLVKEVSFAPLPPSTFELPPQVKALVGKAN